MRRIESKVSRRVTGSIVLNIDRTTKSKLISIARSGEYQDTELQALARKWNWFRGQAIRATQEANQIETIIKLIMLVEKEQERDFEELMEESKWD